MAVKDPLTTVFSAGSEMLTSASTSSCGAVRERLAGGDAVDLVDRVAVEPELHGESAFAQRSLKAVDHLLDRETGLHLEHALGSVVQGLVGQVDVDDIALQGRADERVGAPSGLVVRVGRKAFERAQGRIEGRDCRVGDGELPEQPGSLGRLPDVVRRHQLGVAGRRRPDGIGSRPVVSAEVGDDGEGGDRRGRGEDGPADGVPPRPPGGGRGAGPDVVEPSGRIDVGDRVREKLAQLVVVHRSAPSRRSRRAAEPRDVCVFTEPRLMPRVSAISVSDRSR